MKLRAKSLAEVHGELWIYSPPTEPREWPLSLFHYTSNYSKSKIVNDEDESANFRLSRASDFLDKNEGTYILEPYNHACGYLYDNNIIDFEFYSILKKVRSSDIVRESKNLWILCLTADGYSKFMKEKYAPHDGWLIQLDAMQINEFENQFNAYDNNYPNYVYITQIQYSYSKMKRQLQKAIKRIYEVFQADHSISERQKRKKVFETIVSYLTKYNFCYKSSSYKEEKEIRLICRIKRSFKKWEMPNNPEVYIYYYDDKKDKKYYLHFDKSCYWLSMQQPIIDNAIELNKYFLNSTEICAAYKKRKKEFSKN